MIVEIDGWWGSGKSVLRGLLDGHPKVFASPIHDVVLLSFCNERDDANWLKFKDTEYLRCLLASTGRYFRIERFVNNGEVFYDFSSQDRIYMPVNMDFYAFDRDVFKSLEMLETWTLENVIETVYITFSKHLLNSEKNIVCALGEPNNNQQQNFTKIFPNGKYIFVDRSVKSIIGTRSGRKAIKEDFRSKNGYCNKAFDLINRNEVENILTYRDNAIALSKENPNSYFVISFEDLVGETEKSMNKVVEFLKIDKDKSLNIFSHLGVEVVCNGKKYVGEENDKPEDLLTPEELNEIDERTKRYYSKDIIVEGVKPKNSLLKRSVLKVGRSIVNFGYRLT